MIYTGDGLRVLICTPGDYYHHWLSFTCYLGVKRNLPDATVELLVHGEFGELFSWARRLRLKLRKKNCPVPAPIMEADTPGTLAVLPSCMFIRPWNDSRLSEKSIASSDGEACLKWHGPVEVGDYLCSSVREDRDTPLVSVAGGFGGFDESVWASSKSCFLSVVNRANANNSTETAVLNDWQRASHLAVGLGMSVG